MRTAGVCGGGGVVACNAAGASWWSVHSRTMYETGGMRRVWVRGHDNVRKRVLVQAAALQHRAAAAPPERRRYAPESCRGGRFR